MPGNISVRAPASSARLTSQGSRAGTRTTGSLGKCAAASARSCEATSRLSFGACSMSMHSQSKPACASASVAAALASVNHRPSSGSPPSRKRAFRELVSVLIGGLLSCGARADCDSERGAARPPCGRRAATGRRAARSSRRAILDSRFDHTVIAPARGFGKHRCRAGRLPASPDAFRANSARMSGSGGRREGRHASASRTRKRAAADRAAAAPDARNQTRGSRSTSAQQFGVSYRRTRSRRRLTP
ncbi:hypothetical protein BTQ_164 [Burkholderia thailandensis 2002721723]|nr:hypothetical protein BTQ_164 [Burkholderia thailandensis 2002721723]